MLEFSILGPLEVRSGPDVVPIRGSRQKALLAMLLLHANNVVSADRLLDELWGAEPGTDSVTLRVRVSQLRKALDARGGADLIRTRAPGYVLAIDRDCLDLRRHEQLVADAAVKLEHDPAAAAAGFRDALALWRGPPLADFSYEPFAQADIGRLEELRLVTLEKWFDAELTAGRAAELTGELRALAAAHPLRERFRGQLMLALYRAGRQVEALEEYQRIRKLLVGELGIEPGPALQDLHRALLAHDPALAPPLQVRAARPAHQAARPSAGSPRQSRSTVTALVCDFGLTSFSGGLDAEVRQQALRRCNQTIAPILARYGGIAEAFIGDLMVSVFGIPAVHEDDALRAAAAAVDVLGALRLLEDEAGLRWRVRLSPRLGIATGEIITGGGSRGPALVGAHVAHAASTLRQAARQGEILIDRSTWELARGAVRAEPVGGPHPPGSDIEAAAWRLIGTSDCSPAIPRRLDTPFVGRASELAQLAAAYERTCREKAPRMMTIFGEPGIGKSRLAEEARLCVFTDARLLSGRCHRYGEGVTYAALREIVEQALDGAAPDMLSLQLANEPDRTRVTALVGGLLGIGPASGPLDQGFWAVRRLCEGLARQRPLVLVIEDVHWAEETMLDLIEYVAETACDAPILLLCLTRPELLERRPQWGSGPRAAAIALEPLTTTETGALAASLTRDAATPNAIRAQVVDASQGNPLFAEQLAAMLTASSWPGDEPPLPATVEALIAARLQLLGPAERITLEYASAVGERFARTPIARLVPAQVEAMLDRHLNALVHKQFLRPTLLPGGRDGFRFRHVLVRAAAYRRLLKDERADIHQRYAEWLAALPASQTGNERAETLGHHFERAHVYRSELSPHDPRVPYLADRAALYLAAAGTAAFARADFRAADQLLGRAAALMPPDDPRLPAMLYDRGTSLITLGRLADADAVLTSAAEAGERTVDTPSMWRARLDRVHARTELDPAAVSIAAQEHLAREAISALRICGDSRGLARAWIVIGAVEEMRGRAASQERAALQILKYARRGGTYREIAFGRRHLAEAILSGPTPAGAGIARCQKLTAGQELRVGDVALLSAAALLQAMQGQFDPGRRRLAEGCELMERLGHTNPLSQTLCRRGELELLAADPAAAEDSLRQAHSLAAQTGNVRLGAQVAGLLAHAVLSQGRAAEAQRLAETARAGAPLESLPAQARWLVILAAIHLARAETGDAVALAGTADKILSATDLLTLRADVLSDLAMALAAGGDKARADQTAQLALALYERKGNIVGSKRIRRLFGSMQTAPSTNDVPAAQ
jgi:DNA-binding SARP family transcriptional activator/tetratricopeptide (TPR) repeat protein